jgi:hypothetical protein
LAVICVWTARWRSRRIDEHETTTPGSRRVNMTSSRSYLSNPTPPNSHNSDQQGLSTVATSLDGRPPKGQTDDGVFAAGLELTTRVDDSSHE